MSIMVWLESVIPIVEYVVEEADQDQIMKC